MKVALIHYWLVGMRGGEKVLEALCEMYPDADIYTHVVDPSTLSETLKRHTIKTTFINRLPKAIKWYQRYLPFMPVALEQLDLSEYDLVISSESGPAKGVVTGPNTLHICYCHTPMRYVWDMYHTYLKEIGWVTRLGMRIFIHYLKMWDYASAARVDHFVSNSSYIASRIRKFYRRDAEVVFPPVAVEDFETSDELEDYYLMVGQLVGYKRADLAVEAFTKMGKKLVIIGEGEQLERLKAVAGSNITLVGRQPFSVIKHHFSHCKALIFPGIEDFGIVPLEATASGRPVIAYAEGGALETVKDNITGIFFHEQTSTALIQAVEDFEARQDSFDPKAMQQWAAGFDKARFKKQMTGIVEREMSAMKKMNGRA